MTAFSWSTLFALFGMAHSAYAVVITAALQIGPLSDPTARVVAGVQQMSEAIVGLVVTLIALFMVLVVFWIIVRCRAEDAEAKAAAEKVVSSGSDSSRDGRDIPNSATISVEEARRERDVAWSDGSDVAEGVHWSHDAKVVA